MDARSQNINDDFKILGKSSDTLSQFLRVDEQIPDLFEQLSQRPDRYYVEPYKSMCGSMIERNKFIPFPPEIATQYKNVESASFMGILPEINRVWVTVDNILYLWNYNKPEEPYVYDGISEVIVSVALTAPKPGIFLESVRYLLVVATPVDISVLALCADENFETVRLSPTSYTLPSDNTTMVKIIGSQCGRIFMAGSDFNVYELEYSLSENPWSSVFGGEAVRKCRKVNHFAANWKLEHIVPPLLRPFLIKEDSFADLIVDNSRSILYSISIRGCLNAFYLGVSGTKSALFANGFDLFNETRSYLNNSPYAPEDIKRYFSDDLVANGFTVLNIFPTSVLESKRVHAVVILVNGTRIFLSLQGIRGSFEPDIDYQNGPTGVIVIGVRSPPPSEAITQAKSVQDGGSEQGYLPTFDSARKLTVSTSFYSRGTCFLSLEKTQQPDELLSLFEDNIVRGPNAMASPNPSLREGLSIEKCSFAGQGFNGKVFDIKELSYTVADPDYSRLVSLFHHSMTPQDTMISERGNHRKGYFDLDQTPVASTWFGRADSTKVLPPFSSLNPTDSILTPSVLSRATGFELGNSTNGTVLSDITWQHLPAQLYHTKRQFAVLVNDGIVIFSKSRPADLFLDSLLSVDRGVRNKFDRLFDLFGEKQAAAMFLGLLIGIPGDAGTNVFPESVINPRPFSLESRVIDGVLEVIISLLSRPSYRSIAPIGIEADARVVATRAASDFVKSTFHDSLYTIAGRLIRPIWLRVVVENGSLPQYWTLGLIESIRRPIENLKLLMLQKYQAVIESDGKSKSRPDSLFADDGAMRNQLFLQTDKQLALQAKSLDDDSIRNLYMLLSRSSQLLSLIQLFLTVNKGGVEFSLASLNGFTFRSIAILSKFQEPVKNCINDLITNLIASRDFYLLKEVTKTLSESCYHYFSAGDVHSLEAAKLFKEIRVLLAEGQSGEAVFGLMRDCATEFKRAALFWNSREYILGDSSELKRACSWLVHLNEWGREAIVDVCLTAAENFLPDPLRRGQQKSHREQRVWDSNLYHGGSVTTDDERRRCLLECYSSLASAITSYGSNQILVGGGIIESNSSSYSLSREKSGEHVQDMISMAVSRCQDKEFHDELYSSLLDRRSDALLRVNSRFVESFLRDHDPKLLYKYYMVGAEGRQSQYRQATDLMLYLAEEAVDRSIEDRIDCLHRALDSSKQVAAHLLSPTKTKTSARNADLFRENEVHSRALADRLEIADYQKEIRDKLKHNFLQYDYPATRHRYDERQIETLNLLEQRIIELSNRLVDINALYSYCLDFFVWDCNLLLLYSAHQNDAAAIEKFWRNFIYRLVPFDDAGDDRIRAILESKRARLEIDEYGQCYDNFLNFNDWAPILLKEVVGLGKRLDADRNFIHFPIGVVIEELEDIFGALRLIQYNCFSLDYVSTALRELNIPYGMLVEAYFQIWATRGRDEFIADFLAGSISVLLLNWISDAARQSDEQNEDKRYCIHAVRSQQMDTWIRNLRVHVGVPARNVYDSVSRKEIALITEANLDKISKELRRLDMIASAEYRR